MSNFLSQGYEIERADGTREKYYGWNTSEILDLEKAYHNNDRIRFVCKVYEIENEFHKYAYDWKNGIFRDHNEPADEITEIETAHGIAHYIWSQAIKADEDTVHAFKSMAVDIFGSFDYWRAMAFWHTMLEFDRDVEFLKEVTR